MTERRLERSAVHRGDLILVNAQLPFAGPEEQDRVCLDANVMLARRAAEPLRRLVLETAKELHHIRESLSVPVARYSEKCKRCSLLEYCMPAVGHSARAYCQKLAQEAKEVEMV